MSKKKFVVYIVSTALYILSQIVSYFVMITSIKNNLGTYSGSFFNAIMQNFGFKMIITVILITVCMIFSDVVLIYFGYKTGSNAERKNELKEKEKIVNESIEYYKNMEDKIVDIRKAKHDFNNIINTIDMLDYSDTDNERALNILYKSKEYLNQIKVGDKDV